MLENLLEPLAEDASVFRSKLDNMKVMINGAPDYGLEPQMFYNFEHIQTLSGSAFEPVIVSDYGTVLGKVPGEDIYVLSDPDFVNTRAMGKADIARFGHKITQIVETETGSGGFVFDLTLHGFSGSRNLIKLALTPPFLGATLCLLAMGLLIAWQAFMRFGAPRRQGRPLALGKFSLVQNAANLIKLAGREPKMAKGYAALTRKLVAEDLHIPSGIGDTELNKRLDLYCRKKQAKSEWSKITIYQRETDNNQDLMHAARELYEWRGDMTHDGK